ncbi:anthrone oxygenase family protein [Streptomyces winkii]|uniref:anthrone oxygenase family protein n=1 Tax=Streptomyces winkii TaxID=3051178 RepID=UPI0028D181E4|nr:anthrone oxygenase family protein [Streptomyces sp. DSM 40971]
MLWEFQTASLIAATLTTGLSAGLYYGFACAVMPGLARAEDRTFVETMQRINTAIVNGWFMLLFLGSLVLGAAAAALQLPGAAWASPLPWTVAALVLYVAVLSVTARVNIPLNNALDEGGLPGSARELAALRAHFEASWVRWNLIRAVLNTAAFGCLAWALVRQGHG